LTRRLCISIALVAVITLLLAVPVLAGIYKCLLVVESTGASYEHLALNLTLDVDYLADNGYIDPTGLDTRVSDAGGYVLPHMLANDKVLWVTDLSGNRTTEFILWTGQSLIDSFPIICGHGGYVTVPDNDDLEPDDVFAFGIVGYVDTAAGANKNIIRKDGAVVFNVTNNKELTFAIVGGNSLVATNISSGDMTIMVFSDGYELWMEIGDVERDRDVASSVPDTESDWILFENDVMPYVYYYGEWVVS